MEEYQYHLLARIEDRHWWHRALRRAILEAIESRRPRGPLRVLDIGCGTGGLLSTLAAHDHWGVGFDLSPLALAYCRGRGLPRLARGTMEALPFADDSFDVVIAIDSLTHLSVASERVALREKRRVLRPGGLLILQASAFAWLRGRHDDEVHQRRLTRRQVEGLLAETGFSLVQSRYRLAFMPPLMVVNNWLDRFRRDGKPHLELPSRPINELLHRAALLDLRWGGRLPLGSSIYCLAEKRAGAAPGAG